ncbi:hypothetical protein [Fodinibius sp.]|uniref:hypothetical protein n=1 Tax=Fodinibius sp. TaxID=1872440 RepID=UPI003567B658
MHKKKLFLLIQQASAVTAVAFGVVTVFVGGQTLMGYSDPGYTVFLPLLIFNTLMGLVYAGAGYVIWRDLHSGLSAAKTVLLLSLAAFVFIVILYQTGGNIAVESIKAMSFRTAIWLILWGGLRWITD